MNAFFDIKNLFQDCTTTEEKYQKIIELGRALPPMPPHLKTEDRIVKGCQSIVYLHAELLDRKIYFTASSDALISAGLAALLIQAYSGQSPEWVIQNKPTFLDDLQIFASLSPGRSNGLASMFLRMQQDALKFLVTV